MNRHNDERDVSNSTRDTTYKSQSRIWQQIISMIAMFVPLIGLLLCGGLLIEAYVDYKPPLKLFCLELDYSFFKPGFELLGYSSVLLYIAGYFSLVIVLNIFYFGEPQRKRLGYIASLLAGTLLFLSFWLSFASQNPEMKWWGYLSKVISGTGYFGFSVSTLIDTKQKRCRSILTFISLVLIFIGSVLILFEYS